MDSHSGTLYQEQGDDEWCLEKDQVPNIIKAQFEGLLESNFNRLGDNTLITSATISISHVLDTQESLYPTGELTIGRKKALKIGDKVISSCKSHGMITRRDRLRNMLGGETDDRQDLKQGVFKMRWNMTEEVSKVIEKGVELGIINGGDDGKEKKSDNWSLSEEVAKVIEPCK
ncbi:hypothetical protein LWI28_000779 [Acer negundo]|uniref:Uncharacterized protein n=1 Tax=Acer negundo TaxID=4023 RepID=A0AAD5IH93_ACENE|nr:hypothetical protein LWI28_000779 [Acer negundo]